MNTRKIKKLADAKGYSINKLEQILGWSSGSINKWATTEPSVIRVKKLADFLGVPMEELISNE